MKTRRLLPFLACTAAVSIFALPAIAQAAPFFSEYMEGAGLNKAVEIFNPDVGSLDLSGCEVKIYFNGKTSAGSTIALSGSLASGDVYVLCHSDIAQDSSCDLKTGSVNFNGDDAVELRCGGVVRDVIGRIGEAQYWGSGEESTSEGTLCRKQGSTGDSDGGDAFNPADEWIGRGRNFFGGLGWADLCESAAPGGPLSCSDPAVRASDIQGSGAISPLSGSTQVVRAVVSAILPGLNGFYIQDSASNRDGDPATSDGLWVYDPGKLASSSLSVGEIVTVRGLVQENFGERTEIKADAVVGGCGTSSISATSIPVRDVASWERYEGMLVQLDSDVTINNNYELERYNQLEVAYGDLLMQATEVEAPGAAALALEASNASRLFVIDDLTNKQNMYPVICPSGGLNAAAGQSCRAGAKVLASSVNGPLDYGFGKFRIRDLDQSVSLDAQSAQRPSGSAQLGGRLKVASFNALNYFTTIDGSGSCPAGCRGADSVSEFNRQVAKTVPAILALNADIIALQEMENPVSGVDFSNWAVSELAGRLNARSGRTACANGNYRAVDPGIPLGSDSIQTAFIYCDATVRLLATDILSDADLGDLELVDRAPVFDGINTNRAAIGAKFEEKSSGETLSVVNLHLKSKGSRGRSFNTACANNPGSDPNCDQGQGAGFYDQRRIDGAEAARRWLDRNARLSSGYRIILGDINAYGAEAPVTSFLDNGYRDLMREFPQGPSYTFKGRWGTLDRAFVDDTTLDAVRGVQSLSINAREPDVLSYNEEYKGSGNGKESEALVAYYNADVFRSSDHDPFVIGLKLGEDEPIPAAPLLGTGSGALLGGALMSLLAWRRRRSH